MLKVLLNFVSLGYSELIKSPEVFRYLISGSIAANILLS